MALRYLGSTITKDVRVCCITAPLLIDKYPSQEPDKIPVETRKGLERYAAIYNTNIPYREIYVILQKQQSLTGQIDELRGPDFAEPLVYSTAREQLEYIPEYSTNILEYSRIFPIGKVHVTRSGTVYRYPKHMT